MNIKDITIPLIIHYYLLRAFRTLHKRHAKSVLLVSSVSAPGRWHNAIRVRALNPVAMEQIFPDTPAEKFPSGLWTWLIREYNDDSSHLTYINKY